MLTPDIVENLRGLIPFDPTHLPAEIELIEAATRKFAGVPQYACFDTRFHRDMPRVAQIVPIPRKYEAQGIRRYGFHGLSYTYLMDFLTKENPETANGKIILAHLGSGASLAAVRGGKSLDTTMGFTSTAGLVMATRSGDLDPGLVPFLQATDGVSAEAFGEMSNQKSGLLGVSQISGDLRDLTAKQASDPRAAEAVELFCYQTRKYIGAMAAALGGLDMLVFAGGIGEHNAEVRGRVVAGLEFLGCEIDPERNKKSESVISSENSKTLVRVIRTDEESVIAREVARILG